MFVLHRSASELVEPEPGKGGVCQSSFIPRFAKYLNIYLGLESHAYFKLRGKYLRVSGLNFSGFPGIVSSACMQIAGKILAQDPCAC